MAGFTCNTCGLSYPTPEGQREHMKSEWHRYNLKRRVAQLPSISLEVFNEKVSKMATAEDDEAPLTKKEIRQKKKEELMRQRMELLEKAKKDMMKSMSEMSLNGIDEVPQKEEPAASSEAAEQDKEQDKVAEEKEIESLVQQKFKNQVKIPVTQCLFCKNQHFADLDANLDHMFKSHGLYIPEQKYLVNKVGLIEYLGEKVGLGNVCLVCNYEGKNIEAVRAHMLSKQHCRLPYETQDEKLEISEFYDFSSTYRKRSAKVSSDASASASANDEEWEDVSDDGEAASDDEDDDSYEEDVDDVLYNDGVELYLPTGLKVGHRSLLRYFKQDLKPEKPLTEGQGTVIAAETRHMVSVADKKLIEVQKRAWNKEIRNNKREDKRAAKFINNQPHFRDPLLQ